MFLNFFSCPIPVKFCLLSVQWDECIWREYWSESHWFLKLHFVKYQAWHYKCLVETAIRYRQRECLGDYTVSFEPTIRCPLKVFLYEIDKWCLVWINGSLGLDLTSLHQTLTNQIDLLAKAKLNCLSFHALSCYSPRKRIGDVTVNSRKFSDSDGDYYTSVKNLPLVPRVALIYETSDCRFPSAVPRRTWAVKWTVFIFV